MLGLNLFLSLLRLTTAKQKQKSVSLTCCSLLRSEDVPFWSAWSADCFPMTFNLQSPKILLWLFKVYRLLDLVRALRVHEWTPGNIRGKYSRFVPFDNKKLPHTLSSHFCPTAVSNTSSLCLIFLLIDCSIFFPSPRLTNLPSWFRDIRTMRSEHLSTDCNPKILY